MVSELLNVNGADVRTLLQLTVHFIPLFVNNSYHNDASSTIYVAQAAAAVKVSLPIPCDSRAMYTLMTTPLMWGTAV